MEIKGFNTHKRGESIEEELAQEIEGYVPAQDRSKYLSYFIRQRIKYYGYSAAKGKWEGIKESNPHSYYKVFLAKDG